MTLNEPIERVGDNHVVGDPVTLRFHVGVMGLSDAYAEHFEAFDWEALEKQEQEPIDVVLETVKRVLASEFTVADFQIMTHAQIKEGRKEFERIVNERLGQVLARFFGLTGQAVGLSIITSERVMLIAESQADLREVRRSRVRGLSEDLTELSEDLTEIPKPSRKRTLPDILDDEDFFVDDADEKALVEDDYSELKATLRALSGEISAVNHASVFIAKVARKVLTDV